MKKHERLLVSLSPAESEWYSPVQIQKLMFLNEKYIGERIEGEAFHFVPYDYGPFDPAIYKELADLHENGFLEVQATNQGWNMYRVSTSGLECSAKLIEPLESDVQQYLRKTSDFVRGLSFSKLVSSIYQAFPEMKVNSVFKEK